MNAKKIEYDLDDNDDRDMYEEMLHECYPEDVKVCGMDMDPVQVLKECDTTAYRCGAIDYFDGLDDRWVCEECDGQYDNEEEAEECCKTDEQIEEELKLKEGKRQV